MKLVHFGGADNFVNDAMIESPSFSEFNTKIAYNFPLEKLKSNIEIYGGVKNIFNAYQNDFDLGKNRDSNYIYGPNSPRTFFVGLRLRG